MAAQGKTFYGKIRSISLIRVGGLVLTISGVGLLAMIVSVHRAGIPQRPDPVARRDPGAIQVSLAGTVYDVTGEPRPGADVYLALWRGKAGLGTVGHMVTDASGGYRFSSLGGWDPNHPTRRGGRTVIDWPYYVFASAPGRGFACLKFEPVRNCDDGNLRLRPEHRVSGTVTDATGDPVAGAMVSLSEIVIPDATGTPRLWGFASVRTGALPPVLVTATDSDGSFVLSGLPSAEGVGLLTELDGYFAERVRGDSKEEPVSIVLWKKLTLAVRVVVDGSLLRLGPDARLNIQAPGGRRAGLAYVSGDGLFRMYMKTGHYEITLESSNYEAEPVHVHLTLETSGRPVIINVRETPRQGT